MVKFEALVLGALQALTLAYMASVDARVRNIEHILMQQPAYVAGRGR